MLQLQQRKQSYRGWVKFGYKKGQQWETWRIFSIRQQEISRSLGDVANGGGCSL